MTEQTNSKKQQEKSLGLAGGLAKAFIHSPLTPMLLIACFLLGIMGVVLTPRQEDPQISVPMVDVFVRYKGASAQQVSKLATEPLERMLNEMSGVDHVYSAAMRGKGMVTVQFEVGEELESSLVKLYDKISSNMDKIPPGVDQPLVKPKGVDDVPVVTLTLWSNELDDSII
ncbi:MAG: efflux RND transporter permease subunit, partial [Gammaproteobacteria bacterium]|nr:efflux RND transporter permease subunit [Gammaproteobacteria bacterium]